jgi:hypothetical protein
MAYVGPSLAQHEADSFKSAGVLLYCFDRATAEPVALLAREERGGRKLLTFIGGMRDRRESARCTAAREIDEETCNHVLPEDLDIIRSSPDACTTVLWADFAKYALFVHQLPDHYADLPTRISGAAIPQHRDSHLLGIEAHPFRLLFDDKWLRQNFHQVAGRMVLLLHEDLAARTGLSSGLPQQPSVAPPKRKKGAGRGKPSPPPPNNVQNVPPDAEPAIKFTITLSMNQPAAVPCRYFNGARGCRSGDVCKFAHVRLEEIDPKGILLHKLNIRSAGARPRCSFFGTAIGCRKGESCRFLHIGGDGTSAEGY